MTSVAIAKLPFAWAHTIEERTAALAVLVGYKSARISSVASRHGGSGAVRLCHGCAGRYVLVAEKLTAIQ